MKRKAAAWEKYSKATFLDKIIHQLPAVTATVADAVASTENITIVSNNGNGAGGANKLAREVTDALATMPAAVEAVAVRPAPVPSQWPALTAQAHTKCLFQQLMQAAF